MSDDDVIDASKPCSDENGFCGWCGTCQQHYQHKRDTQEDEE